MKKLLPLGLLAVYAMCFIQIAHATNESSYKWGYSHAMSSAYFGEICESNSHITNETACADGWYHAHNDMVMTIKAYATNERDYKIGFKEGENEYQQCSMHHFCTNEENLYSTICDSSGLYLYIPKYIVGNQTACNHGYFHGWIHECLKDGGGALCVYQPGHIIIAGRTGPGHCYTTKEGETCESGSMIPMGHH